MSKAYILNYQVYFFFAKNLYKKTTNLCDNTIVIDDVITSTGIACACALIINFIDIVLIILLSKTNVFVLLVPNESKICIKLFVLLNHCVPSKMMFITVDIKYFNAIH